jgi:ABC-type multidrug transport system fused ATPase/permease subunit
MLAKLLLLLIAIQIGSAAQVVATTPPTWVLALGGTDGTSLSVVLAATVVIVFVFLAATQWLYEWLFTSVALGVRHALRMQVYDQLLELQDVASYDLPHCHRRTHQLPLGSLAQPQKYQHQVSSLAASVDVAYHALSPASHAATALVELSNMHDLPPTTIDQIVAHNASAQHIAIGLIEDANRIEWWLRTVLIDLPQLIVLVVGSALCLATISFNLMLIALSPMPFVAIGSLLQSFKFARKQVVIDNSRKRLHERYAIE